MHQRPLPPRLKRFCDSFGKRLCPEEACPPYTISVQTGKKLSWCDVEMSAVWGIMQIPIHLTWRY